MPASSFGVGSFDEQGFAVLWLDAVNGSVLWNATLMTPADGYAVRTQLLDALLDEQALYVGGLYYNFPEGEPVTCDSYVARFALPRLTTPASELSVTLGGAVPLALRPGADKAGHLYLVLGSITAFFLAVILFVIVALDDPLRGASGLTPGPLQLLWDRTMVWDEPLA